MAATKLADIIVPQQLAKMARAEIIKHLDLFKTGLATKDYNNVDIRESGNFAEIPFYNEFTGADEVIGDSTSLTPAKLTTGKDIGVVCHRGKAWGSRDLAAIVSGDDPMKEIAKQVGVYWSKRIRTAALATLSGVFSASGPLATSHKYDVSVGTGTAIKLTHQSALTAMNLVGDAMDGFDVVVMHSKVYTDMVNAQLVSFSASSKDNDPMNFNPNFKGRYLGKEIVVTDDAPVDTTTPSYYKYTTFFAKKGAMYIGMQRELQTEHDRDILAFEDVLSTSVHFVPHLRLVKWGVTTTNPANTDLSTVTNWTSVAADPKLVGMVALVTN